MLVAGEAVAFADAGISPDKQVDRAAGQGWAAVAGFIRTPCRASDDLCRAIYSGHKMSARITQSKSDDCSQHGAPASSPSHHESFIVIHRHPELSRPKSTSQPPLLHARRRDLEGSVPCVVLTGERRPFARGFLYSVVVLDFSGSLCLVAQIPMAPRRRQPKKLAPHCQVNCTAVDTGIIWPKLLCTNNLRRLVSPQVYRPTVSRDYYSGRTKTIIVAFKPSASNHGPPRRKSLLSNQAISRQSRRNQGESAKQQARPQRAQSGKAATEPREAFGVRAYSAAFCLSRALPRAAMSSRAAKSGGIRPHSKRFATWAGAQTPRGLRVSWAIAVQGLGRGARDFKCL